MRQKDLATRLKVITVVVTTNKSANSNKSSEKTCHNCAKTGHYKKDCKGVSKSKSANVTNATQGTVMPPCPACGEEHTGQGQGGKVNLVK